ncbi:PEP-CTERM sorting domain-containing protein [Duganella sp. FT135W]|uniref:PEP-CTERM sorting domain-containing protein n=1 Tax=Duganella flavida TaxID=2692175 RepID=A0A6L8KG08_9BURK|nr:PEP-CTERM sorting domain-containing protein [Duganella flavida]MYM26025.1 PEP-CTERM sorting domain-containing protein [Duganella flavida]
MKIKFALKTAALAAALAFSTASHADIGYESKDFGLVFDNGGSMLHPSGGAQFVETYNVKDSSLAASILAFCIQPTVEQGFGTVYTQQAAVTSLSSLFSDTVGSTTVAHRGDRVQALFEQNYAGLSGNSSSASTARLGFALALWDLVVDDANLSAGQQAFTSGAIAFNTVGGAPIALATAQTMLDNTIGATLTGAYKYTEFTGKIGTGSTAINSQNLLSVSSVPEADTWAMMAVGLGLIGFMNRRKSDKSEKFAA